MCGYLISAFWQPLFQGLLFLGERAAFLGFLKNWKLYIDDMMIYIPLFLFVLLFIV